MSTFMLDIGMGGGADWCPILHFSRPEKTSWPVDSRTPHGSSCRMDEEGGIGYKLSRQHPFPQKRKCAVSPVPMSIACSAGEMAVHLETVELT